MFVVYQEAGPGPRHEDPPLGPREVGEEKGAGLDEIGVREVLRSP